MAMGAAMLAQPAAAAITMTFDVSVTSAIGDPTFVPFDFQEQWTFTAHPAAFPPGPPPGFGGQERDWLGPATVTDSPVTAALKSLGGITGVAPTESHQDFSSFQFYFSGSLAFSAASDEFFQSVGTSTSLGPDDFDTVSYRRGMSVSSPGFYLPAHMNEAGLLAFLAANPTLGWSESLQHVQGGIFYGDPDPTVLADVEYDGTATLVSAAGAVPEPATWTMLMAGVLGLGAALRRRRGLALA